MASLALAAYRLLSPLQPPLLRLFSKRMPRLKTFLKVRANLFEELEQRLRTLPEPTCRLWIHASSVGEFEQARTIIAELRQKQPEMDIVVSFFSDSGYEARKHYPDVSAVFYLPIDTPENAQKLVDLLGADIFMLMRYDFWPNHLAAIKKSGAKMILAAAALPPGSPYLKRGLRGLYRHLFGLFDAIFTIDDKDVGTFRTLSGCASVRQAGDPRFDQVVERQMRSDDRAAKLKPLFRNRMVLVGGSVWEPDEAILVPSWLALRTKLSLVLVPHKVERPNIERLLQNLRQQGIEATTISEMDESFDPEKQVLVVDQTGYLAELYTIASIAYVGGAFGINVHNTIEPAAHAIPVLFGPRYRNSPEAGDLVESGGAIVVTGEQELRQTLSRLTEDSGYLKHTGEKAGAFVRSRLGATPIVAEAIAQFCRTQP